MLSIFGYTLIAVTMVYAVPFGCNEDDQCSSGYFCEQATHLCRECLRCRDLGRNEPHTFGTNSNCIRSGIECGLCFDGLVYYDGNIDAKCVPTKELNNMTIQIYILSIAILISIVTVIMFIRVLRNTSFLQITYSSVTRLSSPNYNKMETEVPSTNTLSTSCKN